MHAPPATWIGLAAALGGGACGGDRGHREPTAAATAPGLDEEAAGRLVVAEVDGRPIYGDCVATQAAAHHLDVHAALDECISFELLAREAERRGYASRPEVLEARRNEAARAFIDHDFAPTMAGPDDVPMSEVTAFYQQYRDQLYVHPEWRTSYHVLARLPFKTPVDTPQDRQAHALIDEIDAAITDRRDLDAAELERIARQVAGERKLTIEEVPGRLRESLDPAYRDALYALPARPGALSRPVRSAFGWHLILLTGIEPPLDLTVEQAAADIRGKIFEAVRRRAFQRWVAGFVKGPAWVDEGELARLAAADQAGAPAPSAGGDR